MATVVLDSPIGPLTVEAGSHGVVRIGFGARPARPGDDASPQAAAVARQAADEIDEYFAGTRTRFDVPLDWAVTDGFRADVLAALVEVPYGEVVTYGELAALAGRPGAARAVGTTMATNPWPVVVACHRVVRAGGRLGQYGAGVEVKRRLLDLEGADVPRQG
jgi:methylated-DNA-[protein]-cysteine S-methyltransferase